jgi:hypothetical protein
MRKATSLRGRWLLMLAAVVAFTFLVAGCSNDKSLTKPDDDSSELLAGGGRAENDDPFIGGPGDSGPNGALPGGPDLDSTIQYFPLLYSEFGCPEQTQYQVITDQGDWELWWDRAVECMLNPDGQGKSPFGDLTVVDSGRVEPDSGWVREAPSVDFGSDIVIVIKLEEGPPGRFLWIREVTTSGEGATINYEVVSPGDDCLTTPEPEIATAPVGAFVIPSPEGPISEWMRTDTTYDCSWEPDPALPLTLYYTDADCDLGPNEQVIRSEDGFKEWLDQAWECDMSRWNNPDGEPRDPTGTIPGSVPMGFAVDFTTHAVIILRADRSNAWGGGIWLNSLEVTTSVTTIAYSVMMPGDDCPPVEGGTYLQPTVAIRVPLPLTEPMMWERRVETIDCDWGGDSRGVKRP